jgi:cytohesin
MRLLWACLLLSGLPALGLATPLSDAVSGGDLALVKQLLAGGADPNEAPEYDDPPVRLAALLNRPQIVAALLEAGADPDKRREWEMSALGVAAFLGSTEALLVLPTME